MSGRTGASDPDRTAERDADLQRVDELLRIQRNAPAPALADAVLRRVAQGRRPLLERLFPRQRRRWLRPLVLSASTACALALVGGTLGWRVGLHLIRSDRTAHPTTAASPLSVQRIVRLALTAPGASSVGVVGDFNGWSPDEAVPMARIDGDRFMTTLELAPGRYAYAFVVDGVRVQSDPHALVWEDDGFGGRNSVVEL